DIVHGLKLAVKKHGSDIKSAGIDTWAVDYGLLDANDRLLGLPYQYRDARTDGMAERANELLPDAETYARTGIMPFFLNTSLQLLSERESDSPALAHADQLLLIPDLLAFWLTGQKTIELTNASTTQLYNPESRDWAWEVIDAFRLPRRIFGKITEPGTPIGSLRPAVEKEIKGNFPLIATASHDTAAAVAGLPGSGDYAFISSGTWAIIGTELSAPVLSEEARLAGFANEQGVEGTTRFLKNICGLWLIQECQRHWAAEGNDLSYAALAELAAEAPPFTAFIDPDDPLFASPGEMPEKIAHYCRESGQSEPTNKGTILRIATESIALKHRVRLDQLRQLTGKELTHIHMGGGGIQNKQLTQAIADACGLPLHAGPIEATACGNLITQLVGLGTLPDIAAGRALIKNSEHITLYEPKGAAQWQEPLERFQKLLP
ncbi:MAG: rhamnulokinase, partial [Verrucomicrobiales bacterium]